MRYLDTLEARQTRDRLFKEELARSFRVLDNLIADGARTGPSGNVLRLAKSLTDSQRELMLVDL